MYDKANYCMLLSGLNTERGNDISISSKIKMTLMKWVNWTNASTEQRRIQNPSIQNISISQMFKWVLDVPLLIRFVLRHHSVSARHQMDRIMVFKRLKKAEASRRNHGMKLWIELDLNISYPLPNFSTMPKIQ